MSVNKGHTGQDYEEAFQRLGNNYAVAREFGVNESTVRRARNNLKVDPAIKAGMQAIGTDMVPVLGWAKSSVPDENGLTYSYMLKPDAANDDIIDRIRSAVEGIAPALPVDPPGLVDDDLMTLYPIADAHVGMMAWGIETGEDYDTKIAVDRLTNWVGKCVASSPPSKTAIVLGVGDLLHADDQTNMTPRSKHALDVDTRHFKTIDMTIAAIGSCIEAARVKHETVLVRILPGNHDMHAYMAILFSLFERYREDARVIVQKEPGEFFAHEFGKVLIAAHHGDKAKAQNMVLHLADRYPEMWGRTRHRFLFTGHLHHHKSQDIGGVQWEQLRAVTSKDAYATAHGYTARSEMQAVTYHRERGEVSRVKVAS